MLRLWSGHPDGGWPTDDFSVEENLADMEWHSREQRERIAFTYTVLNPAEDEVLGCIYIVPFEPLLTKNPHLETMIGDDAALVRFWVVAHRLADGLDERLLRTMVAWFEQAWAFRDVYFHVYHEHAQQIRTFEKSGLTPAGSIDIPRRGNPFLLYK